MILKLRIVSKMSINSFAYENWTLMQNYESLTKGYEGKIKIVITMFQRGKRLNKEMRY